MTIREAVLEDIDRLERIYNDAFASNSRFFPENMVEDDDEGEPDLSPAKAWANTASLLLAIEEAGELAGGAIITCSDTDRNTLNRLFIAPKWQGQGVGTAAWNAIEKAYFNPYGWTLTTPTCLINNACFYINKCGFVISQVTDVASDGVGMFVFTKNRSL